MEASRKDSSYDSNVYHFSREDRLGVKLIYIPHVKRQTLMRRVHCRNIIHSKTSKPNAWY